MATTTNAAPLWATHLSTTGEAFRSGYHEKPRKEILPLIDWQPRRLLDIGCGGGATGHLLAEHYPDCVLFGVERDARAAEAAAAQYYQVVHADLDRRPLAELGLPLGEIDTVLLLDVLEHLVDPWRVLVALRQALPPGARIVASLPNIANVEALHALASGRWPYAADGLFDITHLRFFTTQGIRELFEQTGYAVLRVAPVAHPGSRLPTSIGIGPDHVETPAVVVKGLSSAEAANLFTIQHLIVAGVGTPPTATVVQPSTLPAAALKLSTTQRLREAYLRMVRHSVLGLIHEDPAVGPQGQRRPFDPEAREEGLDWPASAHSMIGHKRMLNLQCLAEQVIAERVPGDFIETGVWRGGACIMLRAVLEAYGVRDRRVWVADSFAGLPPPSPERYPLDAGDTHHQMSELAVPLDEVRRNFDRYGLLDDQVQFLKGWFRDTLPGASTGPLALMRLDGDMYESTMDALEALFPRLSPGGFVIVDDYGYIASCKAAVDDYREHHGVTDPLVQIDQFGVYWRNQQLHALRLVPWRTEVHEVMAVDCLAERLRATPLMAGYKAPTPMRVVDVATYRAACAELLAGHNLESSLTDGVALHEGGLRLTGWVVGRQSQALSVSVHREGQVVHSAPVSVPRPDVARRHVETTISGFALDIPRNRLAPGGPYQLVATLAAGQSAAMASFCLAPADAAQG